MEVSPNQRVKTHLNMLALAGLLALFVACSPGNNKQVEGIQHTPNGQGSLPPAFIPEPPIATPTLAVPPQGEIVTEDGQLLPQELVYLLTNVIDPATESGSKFYTNGGLHYSFHGMHGREDLNENLVDIYSYTGGAEVLIKTGKVNVFAEGPDGLHSILAMESSPEINNGLLENHNSDSPIGPLRDFLIALRSSGTASLYPSKTLTSEQKDVLSKNSFSVRTVDIGDGIRVVNVLNSSQQLLFSFRFTQNEANPFDYDVHNVFFNTPQNSIDRRSLTKTTQPHLFGRGIGHRTFVDDRRNHDSATALVNEINEAFNNGGQLIKAS